MLITFEPSVNVMRLNGATVSLHCHHYNCGLIKALEEMEVSNVRDIIIGSAAEEFYINFKNYISNHLIDGTDRERLAAAADLYRFMGFGRLDLAGLNNTGGIARADSSYYVVGWLAKYGRRKDPVCHVTCGFLKGILSAVYDTRVNHYSVEERSCMIRGDEFCEFVVSVRNNGNR
ncbi:MAG: 4-vinyl reductase [Nitrospirota bacterium]